MINHLNKINIREQVEAQDVIKYGVIPEFMGRFPIIVGLDALTESSASTSVN